MALGLSGCSSTGTVSGKVSYKGNPVKGGSITFVSPQGKASASTSINEDGTYTIPSIPAGDVKVCVDTSMLNPAGKTAPKYSPPGGQNSPYGPGDASDGAKRYVAIPTEYADPDKTNLTCTVRGGRQTFDIELK